MPPSSPRKRVTFADSDVVMFFPTRTLSEEASEAEESQIMSSTGPPSNSPTSTSSLSTSDPHTPPWNSTCNISIEGQDVDIINSDTPSDAVARSEVKTPDMYEALHPCLSIFGPVQWNMLTDPQISPRPHELDQFGHDFMMRDAFADSISTIQLYCELLPWPIIIDIEQDGLNYGSPQIDDIFNSIYASLWKLASSVDFVHQTRERQRRIRKAYSRRCRQLSIQETDGLRRIDFLEGQTIFSGLFPGNNDDEWHLRVRQE